MADPTTIEQLYTDVLGRGSDTEGAKYWQQQFGDTIDPNEIATFKAAAAPEISARSAANDWFAANPTATPQDVASAVQAYGGLTPQLASVLADHYGTDVGTIQSSYNQLTANQPAASATSAPATSAPAASAPAQAPLSYQQQLAASNPAAYSAINNVISRAVNKDYGGQSADWMYQMFGGLDPSIISTAPKFLDMAPATTETRTGYDGESGTPYTYQANIPAELKPGQTGIEPLYSYGDENTPGGITGYRQKIDTGDFQNLYANYDANGNLTGYSSDNRIYVSDPQWYGAQWDPTGKATPVSGYTSGGGWLKNTIQDAGPLGQIALAVATGGLSLPEQLAANAAYQVAGGANAGQVAKGTLGSLAGAELIGSNIGQDTLGTLNTIDPSGILAKTASGAVMGGAKGVATGQDFVNSLAAGATTGGISGVTSAVTSNVPGFSDLSKTAQRAINTGVAGILSGKPLDQATLAAAMSFASGEAKKAKTSAKTADAGMPGGLQLAAADTGVVSDAGNGILTTGAPVYAGTPGAEKIKAPVGYELMSIDDPANDQKTLLTDPQDPFSGQYKADGSFYDITQNAWFKPTGELASAAADLNNQLQGIGLPAEYGTDVTGLEGRLGVDTKTGPLSTGTPDLGTIVTTAPRETDIPEITITAPRETVDIPPPDVTEPPLTTVTPPGTTVTPPGTTVTPPGTTVTTPKTTTSPLASAAMAVPKLDSSPQGLTSTMQRNKKILKELHQLFGTLTPELVSALEDRGIHVPRVEEFKEPSIEEELADEKPETPQQLAEDKTLETKLVASGGSISNIDPKITYEKPGMFAAAPVLEQMSRLGTLKHLREGIAARPMGGLAKGGLPHKYAEATPDGHKPEFITGLTGYYASGAGTGQSDDIDAILHDGDYVADADLVAALGDGSSKAGAEALEKFRRQVPHHEYAEGGQPVPAKIADGEYVFPASFVTALGKGDNKAGAALLDKMREAIREHKRSAPVNKIPPKAKSPLDYLKMVKG